MPPTIEEKKRKIAKDIILKLTNGGFWDIEVAINQFLNDIESINRLSYQAGISHVCEEISKVKNFYSVERDQYMVVYNDLAAKIAEIGGK